MIVLTPCPRENLCSSAIKNVDVVAVGSEGDRVFEKKINHILLNHGRRAKKSAKLSSSYREYFLQNISEIEPVILVQVNHAVISLNVFVLLRINNVWSRFVPFIVITTSTSSFSPDKYLSKGNETF